jgi:hypothetical protein
MTDHYSLCEAAVMTKLRTLTAFFPNAWQVSDDDSVIQNGADYLAIFQPDAFPQTRIDGQDAFFNWAVIFDLYVRYSTRKESLPRFKAIRSALINLLHPTALNSANLNVSRIVLSANGGLQQDLAGDNPNFIIQTLNVVITQRVRPGS